MFILSNESIILYIWIKHLQHSLLSYNCFEVICCRYIKRKENLTFLQIFYSPHLEHLPKKADVYIHVYIRFIKRGPNDTILHHYE
jgi:hypothetical protein